MIKLTVNGEARDLTRSLSLPAFLEAHDVNLQHVAVAYNGEVLHKEEYPNILLKDEDVLEIVRPVGGG